MTTNKNIALNEEQETFAQKLLQAYQNKKPLVMDEWAEVVNDDNTAYALQDRLVKLKGLPTGGYKVSLTSKRTQDMFDSDSPLYGQQVDAYLLSSLAVLSLKEQTMAPLVEAELGFRTKTGLHASDSMEDLLHKATVCGALEIPGSRFADWLPDLNKFSVMSDCVVGGYVVYDQERPTDEVFKTADDAANANATLYHDGKEVDSKASSEVLGNPLESLQWPVRKLEEQGKTFRAGQLVSSGTFPLPPHLTAGKWEAKFDSGFGTVSMDVAD